MLNDKTINVVNRIMKNYGYEETLDKTSFEMLDCLNVVYKNKNLVDLFDRYDKDKLTKEEKMSIKTFKHDISNIINNKDDKDNNKKINLEK